MSKTMGTLAALAVLTGLSACNDYETPRGVVGAAYEAIQRGNTNDLRKTLAGSALARHGHSKGMAELRNRLRYVDWKLGRTILLSTERHRGRVSKRFYRVELLTRHRGDKTFRFERDGEAEVVCHVTYVVRSTSPVAPPPCNVNIDRCLGTGHGTDYGRNPGPTRASEETRCWIYELN